MILGAAKVYRRGVILIGERRRVAGKSARRRYVPNVHLQPQRHAAALGHEPPSPFPPDHFGCTADADGPLDAEVAEFRSAKAPYAVDAFDVPPSAVGPMQAYGVRIMVTGPW